jgi:peptidyl-prolyl cis-trans isomerase C
MRSHAFVTRLAVLVALSSLAVTASAPVRAQTSVPAPTPLPTPAPTPAPLPAQGAAADPVVGRVNGQDIKLSEVSEAAQALPEEMRGMPSNMLFPMLLDQVIDRHAILVLARRQKLEQDPDVARMIARAQDQALQTALITREVGPLVTDAALRARYDRDIAGKPGEEEVHARHVLVATEAEAKQVIADLKKGGDFAAIAKARSSDPGAASQGGDLGFFKRADMLPEFASVAFALKPGQTTETPVKTQYGWHVIRVEERRTAPPVPFDQARDELRQKMIQEGIEKVLKEARNGLQIERFNADGSPSRPTDAAEPPPAPKK